MTLDPVPAGTDRPTYYSSKAAAVLGLGEVADARAYHRAAAAALMAEMAATHPDKRRHPLRFQTATQFFKAGDYEKAKRLAAAVEPARLPSALRSVLANFREDCATRTRPGYADGIRKALLHCYPLSAWQRALDLLAAHPYVIEPTSMAYMRGVALEHLGRYRSAARCHAVALRNPQLAPGVLSSATVPDRLISAGRWEDAEGYMRALVDAVPHPFVLASASFVFYRCIRRPGVTREARGAYVQAQIDAMVRAGAAVVETPSQVGDRNAFGQFLAVVLVAAAETFLNVGRPDDAWRLLADAHTLDPAFAAKAEVELRRQVAERARRAAERNTAADQDDEVKLPDWAIANRADPMDRRRAHTTETTWQNLGTAA